MIETSLLGVETFVAVARAGSFAAASRDLGISPAMVGRRIEALEARYGLRLIERTTRVQRLTDAGERFLNRAETLLEAASALDEQARGESGDLSGRIRVSAPTTLGAARLPAILAQFAATHPSVAVETLLSNRRTDLVSEGFDLAIRIGELRDSSLIARRIGTYRFGIVASPDYLARHGRPETPDDLSKACAILNLNLAPRQRWPLSGPGGMTIAAEVSGPLEFDNDEAQRHAALAGAGVAYLPLDLVAADIAEGHLVRLMQQWQVVSMPIHVLYPSRKLVPRRVSALSDALAEGLRETLA